MNLLDSVSILKDILTLKDDTNKTNNIKNNKDIYNSDNFNNTIDKVDRKSTRLNSSH